MEMDIWKWNQLQLGRLSWSMYFLIKSLKERRKIKNGLQVRSIGFFTWAVTQRMKTSSSSWNKIKSVNNIWARTATNIFVYWRRNQARLISILKREMQLDPYSRSSSKPPITGRRLDRMLIWTLLLHLQTIFVLLACNQESKCLWLALLVQIIYRLI